VKVGVKAAPRRLLITFSSLNDEFVGRKLITIAGSFHFLFIFSENYSAPRKKCKWAPLKMLGGVSYFSCAQRN
jgi:hypothetical protein